MLEADSIVAAHRLMASYLIWDIRSLLKTTELDDLTARERFKRLLEMFACARRAADLQTRTESDRLGSVDRDEYLLRLILSAYGDNDPAAAIAWMDEVSNAIDEVAGQGWIPPVDEPRRRFLEESLTPFLCRLRTALPSQL